MGHRESSFASDSLFSLNSIAWRIIKMLIWTMSGKKRNQIQCAHFNEEKCDRNEEDVWSARSVAVCTERDFKTKAARKCFGNLLYMFSWSNDFWVRPKLSGISFNTFDKKGCILPSHNALMKMCPKIVQSLNYWVSWLVLCSSDRRQWCNSPVNLFNVYLEKRARDFEANTQMFTIEF